MAEYIKREAVIDLITHRYENPEICTQEINSIPAADVAPVVRCQDCKYCFCNHDGHIQCSNSMGLICPAHNAYCNYGEEA